MMCTIVDSVVAGSVADFDPELTVSDYGRLRYVYLGRGRQSKSPQHSQQKNLTIPRWS